MKKLISQIVVGLLVLCVAAATYAAGVGGGTVWKAADAESPVLIKYVGSDSEAAYITVVSATAITLTVGSTDNTIATTSGTTVATVLTGISDATNSAGARVFSGQIWAALTTDSAATKFMAVSKTQIERKVWSYLVKWDTSAIVHYDACLAQMQGDGFANPAVIERIMADPTGTGNVTVNVYSDGEAILQRTFTSPTYVQGASYNLVTPYGGTGTQVIPYGFSGSLVTMGGGDTNATITYVTNTFTAAFVTNTVTSALATNTITMTADPVVYVDIPTEIRGLSSDTPVFLRVTRATTATTGGCGATFSR